MVLSSPKEAAESPHSTPKDSKGWDGKLRLERRPVLTNPEALSDPDYSDEDAPPVQEIEADEDLLEDYPPDTDDVDLVHCRVSSIPALRLERFFKVQVSQTAISFSESVALNSFLRSQKLCLRQNQISSIHLPSNLAPTLNDLDLYDNLISHIKGLDDLEHLTSLDLSFNKIKHIKNVGHLKQLKDIYFVQNKIQNIKGLEGLTNLRNLELAANRIREIENLETLTRLEELWLGKNKISELKNLSPLVNLKILSIQSNRLTSIQGLDGLESLEELYISHNALTGISGLEKNSQLRVLDISNNQVAHITNIKHLELIEEVWASYNLIASFDEVERELADKEKLSTVYFEGNPLQLTNPVMYRNKVRLALPQLQQIDASK
ncbi:MAG: Protein phosphatase 1 regulatory subunit sds22 [Candelaria pacifica]|nr:MAG: Protein phosphatase 1 regulatory subunit sds22 [Candelaria pacifica]